MSKYQNKFLECLQIKQVIKLMPLKNYEKIIKIARYCGNDSFNAAL